MHLLNSYNVAGANVSKTYARSGSTNRKARTRRRVASRLAVDPSQIACRNVGPIITMRNKEEHSMMDVVVLGLAFGLLGSRSTAPTSAKGLEENGHDL